MKERINRLARGILDMEVPAVAGLPKKIEGTVQAGMSGNREFFVNSGNTLHLKGLIYADNSRIVIEAPSFGGMRNKIVYQVDASHLEHGDEISGQFHLVTNGGEYSIPYLFHVELGASGQILGGLRTPEDFAKLAENDLETTLRLFDYQDFTETAFMQDMHIRALYDGLKGHADRGNQLEEFLVALGVKQPVTLEFDQKKQSFDRPSGLLEQGITVRKKEWGYVSLDVSTEGAFLSVPQKHFEASDFSGGSLQVDYRILPGKLHAGRNLGCIHLRTAKGTETIPVEIKALEDGAEERRIALRKKKAWAGYMKLRLDLEAGIYETSLIRGRISKELDILRGCEEENSSLISLLTADNLLIGGKKKQAALVLDECREDILTSRLDQVELYCYYQYLLLKLQPNISQKESLLRLVKKYLNEGQYPYLFFLRIRLDEEAAEVPFTLLGEMKALYENGFHSPFLYLEACRLIAEHPQSIQRLEEFEFQVLNLGVRLGMVEEELADWIAGLANKTRQYSRICHRLLLKMYDNTPGKPVLEAICGMMIKGECCKPKDFHWYEQALEEKISMTRLYEYYLYALPKTYSHLLPKEVLLYFSYGQDLDRHNKSVLYRNILTFMSSGTALYETYEKDMEKFAMEQLFESRINSRLAVIYDHIIFRDMIDEPVAKVLPAILKSYRISCRNDQMKYVIIRYEELDQEDAYLLTDGVAYVPLFSEKSVILFQDAFGNRYADVHYLKTPVMDKAELEKRCFEVYPEHAMLCLSACREIVSEGVESEEQIRILERAMKELPVNGLYRKMLLARIIEYYRKKAGEEESEAAECGYLLSLNPEEMSRRERTDVCETLITQNYLTEAYKLLKEYGSEQLKTTRLLKLCDNIILKNLFDEDPFLLALSARVFAEGKANTVILDYLCEHYNSASEQMFKLLSQAVTARVETYDLEERLLCQMMFSRSYDKLDQTFRFYTRRKKMNEAVVRAYFTVKSIGYFLLHEPADDEIFSYLESSIMRSEDLLKIPAIYLLALSRFDSERRTMNEDQIRLCGRMAELLIREGLVFPYTKKLARFVPIPQDILDKAILSWQGSKEDKVDLMVRILPDEEEFHHEDIRRVYQGIFVCRKVLFEGEIMEYQIFVNEDGEYKKKAEGSVSCEPDLIRMKNSRFACLNEMGLCLSMKEEAGLKKSMQEYLIKNAALEELFPVATL